MSVRGAALGAWMYDKIPEITRRRDAEEGEPLRQILAVLGEGLGDIEEAIEKLPELVDAETCPPQFLPALGAMLGFEFPFDLPEEQQRAFVRFMVALYQVKGTPFGLSFAASRLMGSGFAIQVVDEDWVAKTFALELTSQGDGSTLATELTNKLLVVIEQNTPAGLVPSLVVTFVFQEASALVPQETFTETTETVTAWRYNGPLTKLNGAMRTNSSAAPVVHTF